MAPPSGVPVASATHVDKLAITGAILDPEAAPSDGPPAEGTLLVEDGRIVEVLAPVDGRDRRAEPGPPGPDWRRVARGGCWLAPGFLDLHFHGELVAARPDAFPAALERAGRRMLGEGTTAFLATTVTPSRDGLADDVEAWSAAIARAAPAAAAAACLGLHLEGPWISPAAPGALPPAGIRPFDAVADRAALDRAGGLLRMVTLAPEVPGAAALLADLASRGVVAALGHTRASPAEIAEGVERGLRHVTHLFNAMGPMHHREPGVPGTVLAEDRLSCDLVCDGHHVHPAMVRVAARALRERLVLITDRVDLPGAEVAGDTLLGLLAAGPEGEPWRRPDGTLAGSRLALDRAVRNVRAFAGLGLREAVAACTIRPARLLGVEAERGTLRPGARADLAVLDGEGRVVETWIAGHPAWSAGP